MIYICLLLVITLIIESSVTTLPLVLLVLLIGAIVTKKNEIFLLSFLAGLVLDMMTLKPIGISSLLFVLYVCVIYLYCRKFEIENLNFVIVFSFLGSLIYLFITGSGFSIIQAVIATIISGISFFIFQGTNKKALKYSKYG